MRRPEVPEGTLWRQTPTTKRRHGLKPCRRSETSAALAATRVPVRQTHQLPTQKVSQTVKHITRTTESQALQNKKKLVRLKKPRLPSALGLSGACGVEA
eukprot:scaffold7730_cov110-Isochrysis_galbana.AAC.12